MQQADLMKKALVPHYDQVIIPKTSMYGQRFTTWFVFTPALGSYLHQMSMSGAMIHAQRVMYITAEGIPICTSGTVNLLNDHNLGWLVLAVSDFSKRMLEEKGIVVNGVVPHAIDEDEPHRCQIQAEELSKRYQERFKDRVLFAYTGSTVARKRVDLMIPAFRKAVQKTGNKIALISNSHLSPVSLPSVVSPNPQPIKAEDTWCLEDHIFGHMPHEYITALHSACHFYLWSTCCEGFGVPPLEAMSSGKPVVAGKFAPSTEFMLDQSTIWYKAEDVQYENYGLEQKFEMHYCQESDFVDAIVQAVDIYQNNKEEYANMCQAAKEQAHKYDYRIVYGKILRKYLK
jgi:glycosyltransferase involved in cell wall biosynthesis